MNPVDPGEEHLYNNHRERDVGIIPKMSQGIYMMKSKQHYYNTIAIRCFLKCQQLGNDNTQNVTKHKKLHNIIILLLLL